MAGLWGAPAPRAPPQRRCRRPMASAAIGFNKWDELEQDLADALLVDEAPENRPRCSAPSVPFDTSDEDASLAVALQLQAQLDIEFVREFAAAQDARGSQAGGSQQRLLQPRSSQPHGRVAESCEALSVSSVPSSSGQMAIASAISALTDVASNALWRHHRRREEFLDWRPSAAPRLPPLPSLEEPRRRSVSSRDANQEYVREEREEDDTGLSSPASSLSPSHSASSPSPRRRPLSQTPNLHRGPQSTSRSPHVSHGASFHRASPIPASTARFAQQTMVAPFRAPPAGSTDTLTQCAVCMESFIDGEAVRTLPCLHRYHVPCIDRWLADSRHCPICKHAVSDGG